jgi:antitoxin (DNA-binding transcriptional repressor) of toxin-antitoxin stability system
LDGLICCAHDAEQALGFFGVTKINESVNLAAYSTELPMTITSEDIVPLNKVRATLTSLAEQARAGHEKIITRNGESYVALVDARRLDYYHRLERESLHLGLLHDAIEGLKGIRAGEKGIRPKDLKRKLAAKLRK